MYDNNPGIIQEEVGKVLTAPSFLARQDQQEVRGAVFGSFISDALTTTPFLPASFYSLLPGLEIRPGQADPQAEQRQLQMVSRVLGSRLPKYVLIYASLLYLAQDGGGGLLLVLVARPTHASAAQGT